MAQTVGFVGLGNMGAPFARHLVRAGYDLRVFDIRPDVSSAWKADGVSVCASPKEVADHAETIFLSLPLPDVVEAVACGEGGVIGGTKVRRVVDLSTTGPEVSHRIAARLAANNIALIDAPVSGGVAGAEAGSVAIMLACNAREADKVLPMLLHIGRVFPVGTEPGQGQVAKVLNNLLSAGSLLLAGEAAALGARAGLDPAGMIDVFNAGSGRSSATLDKYPKAILPGTFQLGFTNRLMFKDVSLCLQLADAMGIELPTARAVRDEWAAAMAVVGPDEDFSRIVLKSEQVAGVEVRSVATTSQGAQGQVATVKEV